MTVHMIRVWTEPPANDNHLQRMRSAAEDWASSYDETLTTERLTVSHSEPDENEGDTDHSTGCWRFAWHEDATVLLDDLETDLQSEVDWYRIKYHSCSHDGETGDCAWDESMERNYGTVPAGIP